MVDGPSPNHNIWYEMAASDSRNFPDKLISFSSENPKSHLCLTDVSTHAYNPYTMYCNLLLGLLLSLALIRAHAGRVAVQA